MAPQYRCQSNFNYNLQLFENNGIDFKTTGTNGVIVPCTTQYLHISSTTIRSIK